MPVNPNPKPRIRFWAAAVWLLLWQAASMIIGQEIVLVSPIRVIFRLIELTAAWDFWQSICNTLLRITLGFLLGVSIGTLLAALSARCKWMEDLLAPLLLAIKAVPVASFIILALILFSSRNLAILISFLMVMPILYANVLGGIRAADPQMLEMAQVFQIPLHRRIRAIYMPQVFPYFRSACAVGLGMSWKSGVAAEVIGIPSHSVGEKLYEAKVYFDTPDLFAWTLVIVLVSLAFERLFGCILIWIQNRMEKMQG